MLRPTLVDRANFQLAVRRRRGRVFDDYVDLPARTRPGPGTNGWRARASGVGSTGSQSIEDAADMLDEMLAALDRHEFGEAPTRVPG